MGYRLERLLHFFFSIFYGLFNKDIWYQCKFCDYEYNHVPKPHEESKHMFSAHRFYWEGMNH